ncbi:MAG: TlpA family protein disulfide reductase [Steroidobacteraceae bacterium]
MNTANQGLRGSALSALLVALFPVGSPIAFAAAPARMPNFDLEALEGTRASQKLLEGKVALIDFWATWCEPCLREIPHWNELHVRYRDRGFVVLGVTLQSGSAHEIKLSAEKLNIRYRVVVGDQEMVQAFGGIVGFPATFLVDRSGRIHKKYLGQSPLKHIQIERDIQELLREKPSESKVRAR